MNANTLSRKHALSNQKSARRLEFSAVLVEKSASTADFWAMGTEKPHSKMHLLLWGLDVF